MSISIYDVAIPPLLRGLTTLSTYIDKAAEFAAEREIDPSVLVTARASARSCCRYLVRCSEQATARKRRLHG